MKSDRELAEVSHRYRLPNGEVAVSVTSVTGSFDIGDKAGRMAGAAAKLTREGLNYRQEWNVKRDRGTSLHKHMESWLRGESVDATEDEANYLDALEAWITSERPEVLELEQIVLHPSLGYGGRFDLIAETSMGVGLIDLKTGKPYPVEQTLQLAAYRYAPTIANYDEDGALSQGRAMLEVDWCGCLFIADTGEWSMVPMRADERAFEVFVSLLDARKWAKEREMVDA